MDTEFIYQADAPLGGCDMLCVYVVLELAFYY